MGTDGQKKLKSAKILIVGAGGLGSPAALYLAGAGIGTIGIMDADTVSISNLQRQIMHSMKAENQNKAVSAKQTLLFIDKPSRIHIFLVSSSPIPSKYLIASIA